MSTITSTGRPCSTLARACIGSGTAISWIFLLLVFCGTPASAFGGPIADYAFDGNFDDTAGGSTILVYPECPGDPCNSVSTFGTDADGTYWQWQSSNPRGGGFSITTATDFGESYAIRLKFSFDEVSGYRKVIDFKDRALDSGLYFLGGSLRLFPNTAVSSSTFGPGEVLDLLLVRDGKTNQFTIYMNEEGARVEDLQLIDSAGHGIPFGESGGRLLGFFFDDEVTVSEATTGGKIYALQIWPSTLFSDRFENQ